MRSAFILVFATAFLFWGVSACGDGGSGICTSLVNKLEECAGGSFPDEAEFLASWEVEAAGASSLVIEAAEDCISLSCTEFAACFEAL